VHWWHYTDLDVINVAHIIDVPVQVAIKIFQNIVEAGATVVSYDVLEPVGNNRFEQMGAFLTRRTRQVTYCNTFS
jgi:hypothetical protein